MSNPKPIKTAPRRHVRSFYRDKWKGVVLSAFVQPRPEGKFPPDRYPKRRLTVLITHSNGNRVNTRKIITVDECWTVNVKAYDTTWVPKDWFKVN